MTDKLIDQLRKKIDDIEREFTTYKTDKKAMEKKINKLEADVMRLNKQKDYLKSENYKDHYFNLNTQKQIINRLSENIDQTGTILELKGLNDFKRMGYGAHEHFYVDIITGKTRQVDIVATKQTSFTISETKTKIVLKLWIIADCKYKSQVDLLCFDVGMTPEGVLQFPVFIASDYRFGFDKVFDQNLLITSKITQLVIDANSMKGDHLSDGIIYDSSLQVYDCIRSLHHEESMSFSDHMRLEVERGLNLKRALDIVKSEDCFVNTEDMMERLHLKSVYNLFGGVELIYLDAFIPVIIFDENRGILKADIDSKFQLKNIKDIEIVLYEFSKGYRLDEHDLVRDYIFIVNRNGLVKLDRYLDLYLNSFENSFRRLFERYPKTLIGIFSNMTNDGKRYRERK